MRLFPNGYLLPLVLFLAGCPPVPPPPLEGNFRTDVETVDMCKPVTVKPQIKLVTATAEQVRYQYEWGDNTVSSLVAGELSHIYVRADTYTITAKALVDGQPVLRVPLKVVVRSGRDCTYIVVTDPNPSSNPLGVQRAGQEAQALASKYGGELVYTYETVFQGFAARFTPEEAARVAKDAAVKNFELSQIVTTQETQTSVTSWGLDRIDQQQTALDGQFTYPDTGAGVDVYVVDSGIRGDHREFEGRVRPGFSAIDRLVANEDCNGHGTHVAGIIGGKTFGVAKGVTLYPVRVFDCGGTTSVDKIIAGIDWVARVRSTTRPSVMNLSLGIQTRIENIELPATMLNRAILKAAESGVFTTIAAGNSRSNACAFSPPNLGSQNNILVVGATTKSDAVFDVSNFGPCVDIFAPGADILSAGKDGPQDEQLESGTSMAAPFAAGVAAIYLARNPRATPPQVKQALIGGSLPERISGVPTTPPTRNRFLNTAFLGPSNVRVVVEPSSITLIPGQTQIFTATVVGASNTGVRWEHSGGSSSGSGIVLTYTAPATVGQYTLTAISLADGSKTATARITVANPPDNITRVEVDPSSATVASGANVPLTATVLGTGTFNDQVTWRVVSGGGSLSSSVNRSTVFTAPVVASNTQVVVEAASVGDNTKTATATITVTPPASSITSLGITPNNPTVDARGTVNLTATVGGTGSFNNAVTWAIQSGEGSLSAGSGLTTTYTAPADGGTAVVRATSVQDPSRTATTTITIIAPGVSIIPNRVDLQLNQSQNFSATARGLTGNEVSWRISPTTGVNFSSGPTSATFASSTPGTYTLTATSTADNTRTDTATIRVLPNATVSLTPNSSQQVNANTPLNLSASVSGAADTSVTWSVSPSANATLNTNGNSTTFSASLAGSYTVTATSNANPTRLSSVSVSVQPTIALSPVNPQTFVNTEQVFTVALAGFSNNGVQWGIAPLDGAALVTTSNTARFTATIPGEYTITVRSAQDISKFATSTVHVYRSIAINPSFSRMRPNIRMTFTAMVNPNLSGEVIWSVIPIAGVTLTPNGNQVAITATTRGNYTLTARSAVNSNVTTSIPIVITDQSISAGARFSLVIKSDNTLWAFGVNGIGQFGDGTTTSRSIPGQVMTDTSSISAGTYYSLVVRPDGSLWASGNNFYGQLGDGTNINRLIPVRVMTGVSSVSAGIYHSLVLKSDDTLWAFGFNNKGQLGDGTTSNRSTPVQVMTGVTKISAGGNHSLALKSDGTLWTFGQNYFGELGDGTSTDHYSPRQVMVGVSDISAGGNHSLALKSDGTLWAFGWNYYGQLGDGTTINRYNPIQVMTGVSSVSAGTYHSLALKSDGTLWAFGNNESGRLGDGTLTTRLSPIQVTTGVSSISAGFEHSLALKTDGTLWAFGANAYSQLGDGSTTDRLSPVQVMTGVMLP